MPTSTIFKDLIVIELASALAGPAVGMFFAELGARVIKVENKKTSGDVTRKWKNPIEDESDPFSAYYFSVNWRKESLILDLTESIDRQKVNDLIKHADVVVTNFKVGSAAKLGMEYSQIQKLNSRIIYGSITAYGDDDPRPGFDALIQAESGWMSMNGAPGGPPIKVPLPIIDILAGHQLKEGILVALLNREKTGKGCKVSVSLYDAAIATLANQATSYLNLGIIPERLGSAHPSIAPYGDVVTTCDGVHYLLAVGTAEHFESLCHVLDLDDLYSDERFATNSSRLINRKELIRLLQESTRKLTAADFEKSCDKQGVPLGPIRNLDQVFSDKAACSLILKESYKGHPESKRVSTAIFRLTY